MSSSRRSLRAAVALLALALCAALGTYSAFTDFVESNDNAFESGYLSIAGLTGEALFDVENMRNGSVEERCLTIVNDGTVEYDNLSILRGGATNHVDGNDSLAEDVTMTVERLDGPSVDTDAASCAAFDAAAGDKVELDELTGDLTAGKQSDQMGDGPAGSRADLDALKVPGSEVSYKVTATAAGMDNADASQAATGIKLRFNASQGDNFDEGGGQGGEEQPETPSGTALTFQSFGDDNGAFYHLGSAGKTAPYTNPVPTAISGEATPSAMTAYPVAELTDRDAADFMHTSAPAGSPYVTWDFGTRKMVLSKGTVRYHDLTSNQPRHLVFEGSNDAAAWTTLGEIGSESHTPSRGTWAGADSTNRTAWKYIRVRMIGADTSGSSYFILNEAEFYGTLTE